MSDRMQSELDKIAEKYNLGAMYPEGYGWTWEFRVSDSGRLALREAFELGVKYQMGYFAAPTLRMPEDE